MRSRATVSSWCRRWLKSRGCSRLREPFTRCSVASAGKAWSSRSGRNPPPVRLAATTALAVTEQRHWAGSVGNGKRSVMLWRRSWEREDRAMGAQHASEIIDGYLARLELEADDLSVQP